jgi:solute carrier family 50 protein (sugar transporter)
MVSATAVTVIKVLAGCATFVMVASPSISIRKIVQQKHVGLVSLIPFVSLLANSHVWMMYGLLTKRYFPVFSMFVLGDVLAVVYLSIYWRFTTERTYMKRVMAFVLSFLAIMTIYVVLGALGYTHQSRHGVTLTLGFISDVVSVCLYGAPMEKIFMVLKHKSAAFFNFPMVVAALCNNVTWFTYGLVTNNWFIVAPNILFMVLGSLTVFLCFKYNPKTHPVSGLGQPIEPSDDSELRISVELSPSMRLTQLEDDSKGARGGKKLALERTASSPTYEAMHSPLRPLQLQHQPASREY